MEGTGRQQALGAAQAALRYLLSALKHLAGRRIPMGGMDYDLVSAIKDLRVVQAKMAEAIDSIERKTEGMES